MKPLKKMTKNEQARAIENLTKLYTALGKAFTNKAGAELRISSINDAMDTLAGEAISDETLAIWATSHITQEIDPKYLGFDQRPLPMLLGRTAIIMRDTAKNTSPQAEALQESILTFVDACPATALVKQRLLAIAAKPPHSHAA